MNEVIIKEKYVLKYIRDMLYTCSYVIKNKGDKTYQYHHNTAYEYAPSIIEHGILSIEELNSLGIRSYSKDYLKFIADIRIINYINNLSEKEGKAIFSVINKYNQIIMMSKEILRHNRNIQMREMSEGVNRKIDVEKMSEMPRLLMIK